MNNWNAHLLALCCLLLLVGAPVAIYAQNEVDCDELKEHIEDQIKEIEKVKEPRRGKSLVELKEAWAAAEADLAPDPEDRQSHVHGPGITAAHQRKLKAREKARDAYYERLAKLLGKLEKLNADLATYNDECIDDESTERERHWAGKQKDKYDELEEDQTAKRDEIVDPEVGKTLGDEQELDPKKGESARDHRQRLRERKERLPFYEPEPREDESAADFRKRHEAWEKRMKEKWNKPFWKKVMEEVLRPINERLEADHSGTDRPNRPADDESAIPRNRRNYLVFSGAGVGLRAVPQWEKSLTDAPMTDILLHTLYDSPHVMEEAFATFGDFSLGVEGSSALFDSPQGDLYRSYHLEAGMSSTAGWETALQLSYAQAQQQAYFPVTTYGGTDTGTHILQGALRQSVQLYQVRILGQYCLTPQRRWQPLVGFTAAWTHAQRKATATVTELSWSVHQDTQYLWEYGLVLGLRHQWSGGTYAQLQALGGRQQGYTNLGLQLSFGKFW